MSTRSGKRIHSSFHENTFKTDIEHVAQSERKTRSRRFKENIEELSVSVMKPKKRTNYVSYPVTDDEAMTDTADSKEDEAKPVRSLRRNALKEQNKITSSSESTEPFIDVLKPLRMTRRTRKNSENVKDASENANQVDEVMNGGFKSKKEKKKKKSIETVEDGVSKKKSKKKGKKAKRSGSVVVEDILPNKGEKNNLNKSSMSVDSFYSAAGSPPKYTENNDTENTSPIADLTVDSKTKVINNKLEGRQTRSVARRSLLTNVESTLDTTVKVSLKRKSGFVDMDKTITESDSPVDLEVDNTLINIPKKRKFSLKDTVSNRNVEKSVGSDIEHTIFDLEEMEKRKSVIKAVINTTYEKPETPESKKTFDKEFSHDINTTFDKVASTPKTQTPESKINTTYEKSDKKLTSDISDVQEKPKINTTFEKSDVNDSLTKKSAFMNTTYEKNSDDEKLILKRAQSSVINDTYEKDDISSPAISEDNDSTTNLRKSAQKHSTEMNSTYDKIEKSDITFEKDKKLDKTFDMSSKSSLISSDNSNITLDKSNVSRISITSDDSKDIIINTTPVLIESSMDDSQINTSKAGLKPDEVLKSPETSKNNLVIPPVTPLKREGTFTKDGSDVIEAQSILKSPTRKMSLPSPGCTPFPNKSASKSMLNVTRSLEKSRRSSLAEPLPRATKVMFCSPVNNPVVVAQQRRKVIKSNLKGSNKSFVFEDAGPERRAAPRKRSYTHSDAEEARVKRNRFASGAQSPGRLSRTRTTSATAKLTEPGTPKKPTTPRKSESKISRTKLPNFAALHQREFAKMESLDECQERKARRAKQLLTPTGSVTVLDRASPRELEVKKTEDGKTSPNQQKEENTEEEKQTKEIQKPTTPLKSLPTLKSLNPGYTRFGFKLNCDVNPFSINKNEKNDLIFSNKKANTVKRDLTRPLKEIRNLKRQATLPSLTGMASAREVAKQTVMREKAFTDKRNKTRNENRTVIKGVRTNRRFELQMRMRNIE